MPTEMFFASLWAVIYRYSPAFGRLTPTQDFSDGEPRGSAPEKSREEFQVPLTQGLVIPGHNGQSTRTRGRSRTYRQGCCRS